MHPHISATIAEAHYADLRADADRSRAAGSLRASHFARARSAWRARRVAPATVNQPRAA